MKRNTFTFDGGTVRFTVAGQVIANTVRLLSWLVLIGCTLAMLVLLGIEVGLWVVGGGVR